MPKIRIAAALLSLVLVPLAAVAGGVDREIHVPAGWKGAYEFGYAPVLKVGNRVIVSGVANGGPGTYEERTRVMYERARDLLAAAGADFTDVVEVMTFHRAPANSDEFGAEFDKYMPIHRKFFGDHRPAWTAVGTTVLLSRNADVEMRLEAVVGSGAASRVVFAQPAAAAADE